MKTSTHHLPLEGIRVVELAGLAPAPHCGLILADFGADVIRVDTVRGVRGDNITDGVPDPLSRSKRSLAVNLKSRKGRNIFRKLVSMADVLIDPYRPGTLEKLELSCNTLQKMNPRLIIARLTGYGQNGKYKRMAGHDINYLAMSGILSLMGPKGSPPTFPLNLLADFAGGSLTCALGILLALLERSRSGKGQVIDSSMVDGVAYLASFVTLRQNVWKMGPRGTNWLDGGAPFYNTYETKDGKFMAVGALEPKFYRIFLKKLNMFSPELMSRQYDNSSWSQMRQRLELIFKQRSQAEWQEIFDETDACVTPVLSPMDVMKHPHTKARGTYRRVYEPSPAPRLDRTPALKECKSSIIREVGEHSRQILSELGFSRSEIDCMIKDVVISAPCNSSKIKSKL